MDKFQNKYRIQSARLQKWDYGWGAAYFVTICTQNRNCYFGDIVNGEMRLSEIGLLADLFWKEMPKHFSCVELDAFVVMPNHVHGIIVIDKNNQNNTGIGDNIHMEKWIPKLGDKAVPCLFGTTHEPKKLNINGKTPGEKRYQNQGKETLSSIIGSYKSAVTKYARKIHVDYAWQSRFHDHIIRDDQEFNRIKNYIINNPKKWD